MDDQKKKIKELDENDIDKPSYKALFCIESMKVFFVLLMLFVIWTVAKAGYDWAVGLFNPQNVSVQE